MFDRKQGTKAISERFGGNEDRDRRKRIGGLDACEMIDEGRFESRMKPTGDNP